MKETIRCKRMWLVFVPLFCLFMLLFPLIQGQRTAAEAEWSEGDEEYIPDDWLEGDEWSWEEDLEDPSWADEDNGEGDISDDEEAESSTAEIEATPVPEYKVLKYGSSGVNVRRLQERLTELQYYDAEIDGAYGSGTKAAVEAFQKHNGLEEDGIAGQETQALLYSEQALCAPEGAEPVNVLEGEWPLLVNTEWTVTEEFVPADLVLMTELCDADLVKIKYSTTKGVRTAVEALVIMLEAAAEEGVTNWQISAGYRSYSAQESILNSKINSYLNKNPNWSRSRARSAALQTVAVPGSSEHHLGLAFDVTVPNTSSFSGTEQCRWLHENCWDYGFIIRYQKGKESITGYSAEAWHVRYVGLEHAMAMRDSDLCLEEYLEANGVENPGVPETTTIYHANEAVQTAAPAGIVSDELLIEEVTE